MKRRTLAPVVLVLLILSSLACVSTAHMGKLGVDNPVTLEAHDEVKYVWQANVEPGTEYVVTVTNEEFAEASYSGFIHVNDEGLSTEETDDLLAIERFEPHVSFIAPKDGTVIIAVYMVNWIDTDIEVTLTQTAKN